MPSVNGIAPGLAVVGTVQARNRIRLSVGIIAMPADRVSADHQQQHSTCLAIHHHRRIPETVVTYAIVGITALYDISAALPFPSILGTDTHDLVHTPIANVRATRPLVVQGQKLAIAQGDYAGNAVRRLLIVVPQVLILPLPSPTYVTFQMSPSRSMRPRS